MSYARPLEPSARWQAWVEDKPILSLVVVSLIATQVSTYFGYVFPAVGIPVLPWPMYNGLLGTTLADGFNGASVSDTFAVSSDSFWVGHWGLHFVNGIVFGVLWGILLREDLPIRSNMAKGLLYGVIMTIISAGLLVPYAYVPEQGYGLFLFDGPDGWKLPFGILVWHLIYGAFLGWLWNPTDDQPGGAGARATAGATTSTP